MKANRICKIGIISTLLPIILLACGNLLAQPAEIHWPQYQGDAQHTGLSSYTGPQSAVQEKWRFNKNIYMSSPSIGPDGTIYATSYYGHDGQYGGTLYAVNADGTEKWSTFLGSETRGTPAIDVDGRIYVAAKKLFCLDSGGNILWEFEPPVARGYANAGLLGSPTIGDDGSIFIGTVGGVMIALNRDGSIKWQKNVSTDGGHANNFWGASPAIGNSGTVYMQSIERSNLNKGRIFAFDYATGDLKWSFSVGASMWMSPTVGSDGTIYTGGADYYSGKLFALRDLGTHPEIIWSYPLGGSSYPSSVAFSADGNAINFTARLPGSNRYFLVKLDTTTGGEIWRYQPMASGHIYTAAPILDANGTAYIGTGNGSPNTANSIIAVGADGILLWKYNTGTVVWSTSAIGPDGTLYAGSNALRALVEINPSNLPPVADAGDNQVIASNEVAETVIAGYATDPDGDTLSCRWVSDDVVLQDWRLTGLAGECHLQLASLSLGIGSHVLTLEVDDGRIVSADDMILTIGNSAPNVVASGGGVFEIFSNVELIADLSDYDGDTLYYEWTKDGMVLCSGYIDAIPGGTPVTPPFCIVSDLILGTHNITLTAEDGFNSPVSSQVIVEIVDTTVPTMAPVASQNILWPPTGNLTDIVIETYVSDNSGYPVTLSVEVTSNEPVDGTGDGETTPDWMTPEIDQNTGTIYLQLRAERSGGGSGRVYTVTILATDVAGNSSTTSIDFVVPHDRGGK